MRRHCRTLGGTLALVLGGVIAGSACRAADATGAKTAATSSGFQAQRLPLPADILPSCMAVRPDGTLAVGSMDGDILLVGDADGDGVLDTYTRWAGTLPHWPLGLLAE